MEKLFWQGVNALSQEEREEFYGKISALPNPMFEVMDEDGDSYTIRLSDTPFLGNKSRRIIVSVRQILEINPILVP
jgi:hypothetical protein